MTDMLERPAKVKQQKTSATNSFRSKNAEFWSHILKLLQRLGK